MSKIKTYMATVREVQGQEQYKGLVGLRVSYGIGGCFAGVGSAEVALYGCHVEDEDAFYKAIYEIDSKSEHGSFFDSPEELGEAWVNGDLPGIITLPISIMEDPKLISEV